MASDTACEASARRSAAASLCPLIASTARALLALTRPTTASAWASTALRAKSADSARRATTRSPSEPMASATEVWDTLTRATSSSLRSCKLESRTLLAAFTRLSMSPTRARMSSAAFRPVSARRAARVSPIPAIDALICAPCAPMRSSVTDPVRFIAVATSSDDAPSEAINRCPVSVRRSLSRAPAESRSSEMPSCALAIASRILAPLTTIASLWSAISAMSKRILRSLSE